MDALELDVNRYNTHAFIEVKPTVIELTPIERERTTAGGYKDIDLPPRAPQTFRIIEMTAVRPVNVEVTLTDGKQRIVEFQLLGDWDASVGVDDHWREADGREWRVGDVVRSNGYEVRALVVERGK